LPSKPAPDTEDVEARKNDVRPDERRLLGHQAGRKPRQRADQKHAEAVAGDARSEVRGGHRGGNGGRDRRDPGDCISHEGGNARIAPKVQISTWDPSSTTRFVGSLKNSIALTALRSIHANSFSRQIAIPGRDEASSVWRARKKLVSIMRHCGPISFSCASAEGTSISSMKP